MNPSISGNLIEQELLQINFAIKQYYLQCIRNINNNGNDDNNRFSGEDSFGSDEGSNKNRRKITNSLIKNENFNSENKVYDRESDEIYKYSGNSGSDNERNEENMEYDLGGYNSDTSDDIGGGESNDYEDGDNGD
ncbi:hypothetical protein M0813_17252 [Anaeramoeba flamelloides]|uniref:Uncharacterized protein n=1 Tax=Anaeramoeba flamelloides TaxID=1746091 RepID=A0ABQ8YVY5_9EUKA|nr:hypothetical protein M0813_17252 [Anaeramoeba flamelloides]